MPVTRRAGALFARHAGRLARSLRGHLVGGAKTVSQSSPDKSKQKGVPLPDVATMLVHGINHFDFDPARHRLVSAASCTTTALAHMIRPLLERDLTRNMITAGMSTVHAVTSSQPVLDAVPKAGATDLRKTRGALEKEIRECYVPKYYKYMTVTIKPKEQTLFYYVDGEVKGPARQTYIERTTVLKAIASAQGFTDFAKKKAVRLSRVDGRKFTINCVKAREDSSLDLEVYPGDRVFVPRKIF